VALGFITAAGHTLLPTGVAPRFIQFLGSRLTILALVNGGMKLALVPESASGFHFDDVIYKRIKLDPRGGRAEIHLVWRKENDNPALGLFRDLVVRESRRSPPHRTIPA
jgi:DNA-binding transcriptional LysR family regulator